MRNSIKTIGVGGAGTMGSGIAQACAQAGFPVVLYELNSAVLSKARSNMESNLQSLVIKKKITEEERNTIIDRITFTGNLNDCVVDLFIEAIIEQPAIKINLFNELAAINTSQTLFASNTSSLSITSLANGLPHPQRVIGLHFFNPATIMKLVEVILTKQTDPGIAETIVAFVKQLGKTPVVCKDSPGFIVNRVARPFYIETLRAVEEGSITMEAADRLLEASGFKMGPFRLMDLIGNDVNYAVSCSVYEQLSHPERLRPSPLQETKVKEGKLGKKSGSGFYDYTNG